MTGDEKWTIYNNVKQKRRGKRNEPHLATSKAGLHPQSHALCPNKVMLVGLKRDLYYELLPNNKTINSEKYCSQ